MEEEIIEFELLLRGILNNEQEISKELKTQNQEEIHLLFLACKNIIYEQCYKTILEKKLIQEIKIKVLKSIKEEIEKIKLSQLPKVFSSSLEVYQSIEDKKIETLTEMYKTVEELSNQKIIEEIITILVANPKLIEELRKQKDVITKKKLEGITYNKKPCIDNDMINDDVISKICKDITSQGLKKIVLKVQLTLENNEKFIDLRMVKETAEKLVLEYYISIIEDKIKGVTESIKENKQVKSIEQPLEEPRKQLQKKHNKPLTKFFKSKNEEIEEALRQIELIYIFQKRIEDIKQEISDITNEQSLKELTTSQKNLYLNSNTYKEMQTRRNEDRIELLLTTFTKKLKEEMNELAQELSNSISEDVIANETEQQKIKDFAKRLSISVERLTEILAGNENIYLYLVTTWLMNELQKRITTADIAEITMQTISPDFPPNNPSLRDIIMRTMELPAELKKQIPEYMPIQKPITKSKKKKEINRRKF